MLTQTAPRLAAMQGIYFCGREKAPQNKGNNLPNYRINYVHQLGNQAVVGVAVVWIV